MDMNKVLSDINQGINEAVKEWSIKKGYTIKETKLFGLEVDKYNSKRFNAILLIKGDSNKNTSSHYNGVRFEFSIDFHPCYNRVGFFVSDYKGNLQFDYSENAVSEIMEEVKEYLKGK